MRMNIEKQWSHLGFLVLRLLGVRFCVLGRVWGPYGQVWSVDAARLGRMSASS